MARLDSNNGGGSRKDLRIADERSSPEVSKVEIQRVRNNSKIIGNLLTR